MATTTAARALTDLDVDVLALVLLGLPLGERQREWIYVALACRALHAAVLRAFEADRVERLFAAGLPGGHSKRPLRVIRASGRRFATSIHGAWTSPMRIVYTKERLASHDASVEHLFSGTFVPPRLRGQFLRLQYDPRQTPADRDASEARAAYHLSTRALPHLLQHAPLHTIQACFFEVLGEHSACALHLSLRHHRALVFFATAHGRVDVLDRLVHRNPQRARAYDFDNGLLQLLKDERLCAMFVRGGTGSRVARVPQVSSEASHEQQQRLVEIQLLIGRPAALNDRFCVLDWLSATLVALDMRINNGPVGAQYPDHARHHGLAMVFRFAGVCVQIPPRSGPWLKARDMCDAHWHAFRLLLCEASAGGSLRVLDGLWAALRALNAPPAAGATAATTTGPPNRWIFQAGLMWGVLLHLLLKPRCGAVLRWIVQTCHRDAKMLKAIAIATHIGAAQRTVQCEWHPDTFDAEDLLAVGLLLPDRFHVQDIVLKSLGVLGAQPGDWSGPESADRIRDSVTTAGDPRKMEWLLDEFHHFIAHNLLSEETVFPSSVEPNTGIFCAKTGCGWFARSLVHASRHGELINMLRHDLDPARWGASDSVCCYALRGCCHIARVGQTARPGPPMLLNHGRGAPRNTGSCFANCIEGESELLPESFVFWARCATLGNWLPTENFAGASCMGDSVGFVLRRWLVYALSDGVFDERIEAQPEPDRHSPPLKELFTDWMGALNTAPEACYASLERVCDAFGLAVRETPRDTVCQRTRKRRSVLGRVVAQQVLALLETATKPVYALHGFDAMVKDYRTPEAMLTLAVAYAKLGADNALFSEEKLTSLLTATGNSGQADLTHAMCEALGRPIAVKL